MEIYSTLDYSRFKKLVGNRDVDHSKKIAQSIEKFDLTDYRPILVTKDFEIIDGQNTFEACKVLGKPIKYCFFKEETISAQDAMLALNSGQRSWRKENYVQSWLARGNKAMIQFVDWAKKIGYDEKHFGTAASVYFGIRRTSEGFKNGVLPEKWEYADELGDYLVYMKKKSVPFWNTANFADALVSFRKTHTTAEIKKVMKHIEIVQYFGSPGAFLNRFQQIVDAKKVR